MERFQLEARSAARLHHSNIVPVYGVGEHDGVHYYAMQFIQGHGLDAVIDDLRRLRGLAIGKAPLRSEQRTPPRRSTRAAPWSWPGRWCRLVRPRPAGQPPRRLRSGRAAADRRVRHGRRSSLGRDGRPRPFAVIRAGAGGRGLGPDGAGP